MPRSPSRPQDDRIRYGQIVWAFIRAGWNPPRPSDRIAHAIIDDIARVHPQASLALEPRARDALSLAAQGLTVEETAKAMGISFETAKMHLKDARRQLGARNTPHAVAIASRNGELVLREDLAA